MLERYKKAFCEALEIGAAEAEAATVESLDNWDSLHHMNLVAVLEDEFGIEFEPEDVIEITSYQAGIVVLKKRGVAF